jgi:uncharacterized protein (DUF305 family)
MTKPLSSVTAFSLAVALAGLAYAQTPAPAQSTAPGASPSSALQNLPEGCRKVAQTSQMGQMMQNMPMMQGGMMPMQNMPMAAGMGEANRDYMEAMRKMNPPMMMGMMINDPEVAFICAMIPHHQGAIDMAQAVLKHTKDAELKKTAEKSIEEQKKEIAELNEILKKHVK